MMTSTEQSPSDDLSVLVRLLKALADETRLRLLGLLAARERSVEELTTLLNLKAPTVSHHLAMLKDLHLVEMRAEGNTHLYALNSEKLHSLNRDLFTPEHMASYVADTADDAWERKVLMDFFVGERLKEIPASRKKRSVILRWLAGRFEPTRSYAEAEVNEILRQYHEDVASLRRELIGEKLMRRESGVYWRTE